MAIFYACQTGSSAVNDIIRVKDLGYQAWNAKVKMAPNIGILQWQNVWKCTLKLS